MEPGDLVAGHKADADATDGRLKWRLEALAETVHHSDTSWHWNGCGRGYEIDRQDSTTVAALLPLARL